MDIDELFLFTMDDLESRLELGRPEYDAFMAAWLLRKLLHNGVRSLLSQVADPRSVDAHFRVLDIQPGPTAIGFDPRGAIVPRDDLDTVEVDHAAFLRRIAVCVPREEGRYEYAIEYVIRFLADFAGAVHATTPREERDLAFQAWSRGGRTYGAGSVKWQYSSGVAAIREIGEVVVISLAGLRARVQEETWPEGFPEQLKGLGGQGVVHHPDGTTEFRRAPNEPDHIFKPDGTYVVRYPDGREVAPSSET